MNRKRTLYVISLFLVIVIAEMSCHDKENTSLKKLHVCTELPALNEDTVIDGNKGISALKYLLWPKSTEELTVSFLDGKHEVQRKVMAVAKIWESYCGITFKFGKFRHPHISISFLQPDSWSYIGTMSKKKSPSMNLGWLDENTTDEEYHRVVLHEFGHALGLIHEHLNPRANPIQWNVDSVYAYYRSLGRKWSDEKIKVNFFQKYNLNETNGSDFDPESIMLYAIPKEFTKNGFTRPWNTKLSAQDTTYIGKLYPKSL